MSDQSVLSVQAGAGVGEDRLSQPVRYRVVVAIPGLERPVEDRHRPCRRSSILVDPIEEGVEAEADSVSHIGWLVYNVLVQPGPREGARLYPVRANVLRLVEQEKVSVGDGYRNLQPAQADRYRREISVLPDPSPASGGHLMEG